MYYPFAHLPFHQQRLLFPTLLVLTLLVWITLIWMERPLAKAGASIIDFELAGTLDKAQAIMHAWGEANRQLARRQTVVDFVYLVLYPLTLALGCGLAAGQFSAGSWPVYKAHLAADCPLVCYIQVCHCRLGVDIRSGWQFELDASTEEVNS